MSESQMCRDDHGHLGYMVQCPECDGFGSIDMGGHIEQCPECAGSGEVFVGEEDYYESGLTPVGVDAALPPAGEGSERAAAQLNFSR